MEAQLSEVDVPLAYLRTIGPQTVAPATNSFGQALELFLDHEHAASSRALLEAHSGDEDRLVELAENALRGNWILLDGVEARTK